MVVGLRLGFDLGYQRCAQNRASNNQCQHDDVGRGRTQGAVLFIVVETPDIFDRDGLRFQLERRKLLGKEEFVEAAEQRFPQRLKGVGSQQ